MDNFFSDSKEMESFLTRSAMGYWARGPKIFARSAGLRPAPLAGLQKTARFARRFLSQVCGSLVSTAFTSHPTYIYVYSGTFWLSKASTAIWSPRLGPHCRPCNVLLFLVPAGPLWSPTVPSNADLGFDPQMVEK